MAPARRGRGTKTPSACRSLWSAVVNGKYIAGYQDERDVNLQMIVHDGGHALNQKVGMTQGIAAHRKVEFVLSLNLFLNTNSKYADIVLPVTTQWERYGFIKGNRDHLIWARQISEPMFEAKDDDWIARELTSRLFPRKLAIIAPYRQLILPEDHRMLHRHPARRWMAALLAVALVAAGCGGSDSAPPSSLPPTALPLTSTAAPSAYPEIDAFVARLMALYDIPGAGVALVQDGEVLLARGYGVRSTATGAPVTPETLFAIGSVTKSFTALGVMQLVDQGRIALDSTVAGYVPGFALADPDATQRVTVRQLLAQTSGLPGGDDASWYSGQVSTLAEAVAYAATLGLAAAPGIVHIYDNYNYAIAGYLIEQVTGQTWEGYTREHILDPLGMAGATFDIASMQAAPDHAVPHTLDILDGMQPRAFASLAGIASAGALNISAQGMATYLQLQLGDGAVDGQQVIAPALLAEMHTQQAAYPPQPPVGPTGFQTKGYALGWFVADFNGVQVAWHNGSIDGFYTMVMLVPSQNLGVAVLSNAGLGTGSLFTLATCLGLLERRMGVSPGRDVVAALNEEASFDPAARQAALDAARRYDADPAEWAPLLGSYSGGGGTFTVEARDDALYLGQTRLYPTGPASFVTANRAREGLITTYTFVIGDGGAVTVRRDGVVIGQKVG